MKNIIFVFAAIALLFACTPDNNNNGSDLNKQEELTVTGDALDVTDCSATLVGYANLPIELGNAKVGIIYDNKQSFEDGKMIEATGLDSNNKFTVTVTGLEPSTTYYYKSFVQNGIAVKYGEEKSFTTEEAKFPVGAVDLGIVMTMPDNTSYKLYWAKSNLSENGLCANPEDYGDYYAWGETNAKSNYSWSTYKFFTSESEPCSKYNATDNLKELNLEDDVAHVKLGGKWRIPSSDEWGALLSLCDWSIVDDYNGTGIKGALFIGPNGNSIFLPYAGYMEDAEHQDAGSCVMYWSTLCDNHSLAFSYNFFDGHGRTMIDRYYGFSVRPVSE